MTVATLCLLWPAVAHAQRAAPTAADIRARLHSTDPAVAAWAAFDAATFQTHEVAADLIAVLESPPVAAPRSEDFLVAAVLDALIQLQWDFRLPGALPNPDPVMLERYYARWPVQALLLLGRAGEGRGPVLQRLLGSATGDEWFAMANLLSSRTPVPGFAADVLNGLSLRLDISVIDPGSGLGVGSGAGSGGCGVGSMEANVSGFPPHAVYRFVSGDISGATVLSRGPRTVYYSRRIATREILRDFPGQVSPTAEDRLIYLDALIRQHTYLPKPLLRATTWVSIPWHDELDFQSRVALEQQKIVDSYGTVLLMLQAGGHLTEDETRRLPLALNTSITDRRATRK